MSRNYYGLCSPDACAEILGYNKITRFVMFLGTKNIEIFRILYIFQ